MGVGRGLRVEVKGLGEAVNHGHSGVGGAGFTPPARCTTPHVSEEQVTEAFLDAVHHLLVSRDQVDELISRNARVSQSQSEYQRRFDKFTSEHAALLDEYHQLLAQISDLENRQAAYCYYKEQLAILDPASIEFTPYLWHILVDHAEVGTDDTITFTFRDGAKQTQHIGK